MKGTSLVLRTLYAGERRLERDLLTAAARHRADHELYHVATDIARWSRQNAEHIARAAELRGVVLPEAVDAAEPDPRERTEDGAAVGGPHDPDVGVVLCDPDPGVVLLRDLCDLHLAATANSLNWEMLAQAAQAAGDEDLLALAAACHPQTLRQMSWSDTMLKALSPQLLTSL